MVDNELLAAISDLLDSKLKPIKAEMSNMKAEMSNMKADISNMKADISDIKARISKLEEDVHSIHLHLENFTDKNIQLLAENYVPAAKRYLETSEQIDAMQADIDLLKKVVAEHSEKLQKFG